MSSADHIPKNLRIGLWLGEWEHKSRVKRAFLLSIDRRNLSALFWLNVDQFISNVYSQLHSLHRISENGRQLYFTERAILEGLNLDIDDLNNARLNQMNGDSKTHLSIAPLNLTTVYKVSRFLSLFPPLRDFHRLIMPRTFFGIFHVLGHDLN